ncbi:MAG: hypothetical protein GQ574_00485 [Crocinitomix sp.]|nr:hypothetical protein [Crocinitomix sp.]
MRPELTTLEQIDMYLSGKLSPAEHNAFEAKINADPNLESMVSQQKELIKAVNRKALRAQINAAAVGGGAASGMSNLWIGITSVVGVGLVTAGLIYFNSDDEVLTDENNLAINDSEYVAADTNTINFDSVEEALIFEEPETIFSSVQVYPEIDEDRMNVEVNSFAQNDPVALEINENDNGDLVEVIDDDTEPDRTAIEDLSNTDRTQRASYPGGNFAMDKFIDGKLQYPRSARNKGIEGVVRCEFFVTADGVITDIDAKCINMNERDGPPFNDVKLLLNKRIMNAFINNATHTLRTMPSWVPAKNSQGNPVLTRQRMYFNYDLEKGCLVYQLDENLPFSEEDFNEKEEKRRR